MEFWKPSNWNVRQTPGQIHMHDMVTIDTIVFEIVGGGGGIVNFLKYPGSDRVKTDKWNTLLSHKPEYNKLRQI